MSETVPSLLRLSPAPDGPGASRSTAFSTFDRRVVVREGPLAGKSFGEIAEAEPEKTGGPRFIKMREAGLGLEVAAGQTRTPGPLNVLHPLDDTTGRLVPGPCAGVVILGAASGAKFFWGRRKDLDPERFRTLLIQGSCSLALAERNAEGGGTLLAPSGFPYALGDGIEYLEAAVLRQERGRVSGGGVLRLGGALKSAPVPASRLFTTHRGGIEGENAFTYLFAHAFIAGMRLDLRDEWKEKRGEAARGSFAALACVAGSALVRSGTETEPIGQGELVVVPAHASRFNINPGPGGASIVKVWIPDHEAEIENRLTNLGQSRKEIEGLYGFFGKDSA